MKAPESIKATDLVLLMDTIMAAAGLYNRIELTGGDPLYFREYEDLGEKLRALGIAEVKP
jgi:organic radical activating enzyme